jgi:phosphoenolpyruvate phosphomutase
VPELLPLPQESERFFEAVRRSRQQLAGVGVYDAFGACSAERAGFDVLWLSSLEVSAAKGLPDRNIINATQMATVLGEIRLGSVLPVIVDADNGYGSDENAVLAARRYALLGATAMSIEDNSYPKTNSLITGVARELVEADVFSTRIRRVRAALEERSAQLEVIARTEALVAGQGPAEALARCVAYREAGADAVFVQFNKDSVDEFLELIPAVCELGPVVIAPTELPKLSYADFFAMGVDIVINANIGSRSRVRTESEVFRKVRQTGRLADVDDYLVPVSELLRIYTADGDPQVEELPA